jgi:SAM-dependent methyltransferase
MLLMSHKHETAMERPLRRAFSNSDEFDRVHGTDTTGIVPLQSQDISSANVRFGVRYQPTPQWVIEMAVSSLGIDARKYRFVDLGCGKGRSLIVARMIGFVSVIGVDFAASFVETARRNLDILKLDRVSICHRDAAQFAIPNGNTILFLYNPFGPEVMTSVVANLSRHIGRLFVIYYVPKCSNLFDQSGLFVRFAEPYESVIIWRKA